MNIGGKKRENTENSDYSKRVGLFELLKELKKLV